MTPLRLRRKVPHTLKRLVVAGWLIAVPLAAFCLLLQNIGGTYQTLTAALDAVIVVLMAWNTAGTVLGSP